MKKMGDRIEIFIFVTGIVVLPFCKGNFGISENLMTTLICGSTVLLILLIKVIGYRTGYSESEIKNDRKNFMILLVLFVIVLLAGIFGAFG